MSLSIFEDLPDCQNLLPGLVRLSVAVLFGGSLGFEREQQRKAAGLRTHMLVAGGAALFVLVPLEAGATPAQLTRVIEGLAAGIGFLGAGTIIKGQDQQTVHGLTTAATIWLTAAVGISIGLGWLWPAALMVGLALLVLLVVRLFEPGGRRPQK